MQVGDKVVRYPTTFENTSELTPAGGLRARTGTVVYIHPEKRFHMVEFEVNGQKIRECFKGT